MKKTARQDWITRVEFKSSDGHFHSIPEEYLFMAFDVDPNLTILRRVIDCDAGHINAQWTDRHRFTEYDRQWLKKLKIRWERYDDIAASQWRGFL